MDAVIRVKEIANWERVCHFDSGHFHLWRPSVLLVHSSYFEIPGIRNASCSEIRTVQKVSHVRGKFEYFEKMQRQFCDLNLEIKRKKWCFNWMLLICLFCRNSQRRQILPKLFVSNHPICTSDLCLKSRYIAQFDLSPDQVITPHTIITLRLSDPHPDNWLARMSDSDGEYDILSTMHISSMGYARSMPDARLTAPKP
jgi:hypothetical protein